MCIKRCYKSASAVRRGHRHMRFRVRVYFCRECLGYHAASHEKR